MMHGTMSLKKSLDAPDDERKYRSKHVEQPRNNKLSHTVATCWSFSYISFYLFLLVSRFLMHTSKLCLLLCSLVLSLAS